jgi:hypothetical protein
MGNRWIPIGSNFEWTKCGAVLSICKKVRYDRFFVGISLRCLSWRSKTASIKKSYWNLSPGGNIITS